MFDQPIAHKEKIYVKGRSQPTAPVTVLEYTPSHDQFSELPPPPVHTFTIATLRGKLLVVGGEDKSTGKITNTILTFDEHCQQWIKSHPAMPIALTLPAVMGYQDHLVVAGGESTNYKRIPNVNILDTASNKWKTAQPLPSVDYSYTVLIQDNIYLVCQNTRTVLKAHVPTLISGAKTSVWETLPSSLYYLSSPVTIGNTLLTVGGSDTTQGSTPTNSIYMYNPTANQWTRVGDLPEPMTDPRSVITNSKLFILGSFLSQSVFILTLTLS